MDDIMTLEQFHSIMEQAAKNRYIYAVLNARGHIQYVHTQNSTYSLRAIAITTKQLKKMHLYLRQPRQTKEDTNHD